MFKTPGSWCGVQTSATQSPDSHLLVLPSLYFPGGGMTCVWLCIHWEVPQDTIQLLNPSQNCLLSNNADGNKIFSGKTHHQFPFSLQNGRANIRLTRATTVQNTCTTFQCPAAMSIASPSSFNSRSLSSLCSRLQFPPRPPPPIQGPTCPSSSIFPFISWLECADGPVGPTR